MLAWYLESTKSVSALRCAVQYTQALSQCGHFFFSRLNCCKRASCTEPKAEIQEIIRHAYIFLLPSNSAASLHVRHTCPQSLVGLLISWQAPEIDAIAFLPANLVVSNCLLLYLSGVRDRGYRLLLVIITSAI